MMPRLIPCVSLALLLAGCDPAPETTDVAQAVAEQKPTGKSADDFDLAAVATLLEANDLPNAKAIEEKINDPSAGINTLDLDEDGVTDLIEVVETRDNSRATLTLRAIPSSKLGDDPKAHPKIAKEHGIEVAVIHLDLDPKAQTITIHATYSPHVHHDPEVHVYHHEVHVVVEGDALHDDEDHLFFYLFMLDHEFYHGHYHHHHHHPIIEIHTHKKHKHKKHKKHKHFKSHKFKHHKFKH